MQTAGPSVGSTFPTSGTFTVTNTTGAFSGFTVSVHRAEYGYAVTATDLAANAATVALTGTD